MNRRMELRSVHLWACSFAKIMNPLQT